MDSSMNFRSQTLNFHCISCTKFVQADLIFSGPYKNTSIFLASSLPLLQYTTSGNDRVVSNLKNQAMKVCQQLKVSKWNWSIWKVWYRLAWSMLAITGIACTVEFTNQMPCCISYRMSELDFKHLKSCSDKFLLFRVWGTILHIYQTVFHVCHVGVCWRK